jgi:Ser/Thr protein kinase RdoA (MazF antagonist)
LIYSWGVTNLYQKKVAEGQVVAINIADIAGHFCFVGRFIEAGPFGNGHINDTYAVVCSPTGERINRYILQKINHFVFREPAALMENIQRVTNHLGQKISTAGGDRFRQTLNLVPTMDGGNLYQDPVGDYWRAYHFIEGSRTYEKAGSFQHIYQAAWAFGNFQRLLTDFPAEQLHETIPNFHHTPKRFQAFVDAVQADACNRAAGVREEIQFIECREQDTRLLLEMSEQGLLPQRVTHNDSKFNNVMIDNRTGKGICVIDLDTVMPGLAPYDFGDIVRSAAALAAEDEPERSKAGLSLETFDSLAQGYLDAGRGFLNAAEVDNLAFSARLITLEQAIRFLTDYLNGDVYYKVHRPGQNLDRARTQIDMVRDMEVKYEQMERVVSKYR